MDFLLAKRKRMFNIFSIIRSKEFLAAQEEACKEPDTAYYFARDVKGANIEYCQEIACKDPCYAFLFALHIRGANIEYCQKATYKNIYWTRRFAEEILGADKKKYKIYSILERYVKKIFK